MNNNYAVLFLALVTLVLVALLNTNSFIFDERLFPPNVELMERIGFGKQFLLQMNDQAPGPLYEFIYLPLKPITHLIPWRMRAINVILFGVVIGLLYKLFRSIECTKGRSFYYALHLVAIPTIWQVTGLALTEVPAMVFVTAWFYLFNIILKKEKNEPVYYILISVVTGVALALAVMGRTPYVLLLGCGPIIMAFYKVQGRNINSLMLSSGVQILIVLSAVVPIFIIWGGLVPPLQASVEDAIKPWHGVLATAYLGITGLILNINWFRIDNIGKLKIFYILLSIFIVFLTLNCLTSDYTYAPLSGFVAALGGEKLMSIYEMAVSPLLACFAGYFLLCCYFRIKENVDNPSFILATLAALIIAGSASKISHQFSSRYIAQAAPFIIVMFVTTANTFKDPTKWIRLLIGAIIGFISLNTYAEII